MKATITFNLTDSLERSAFERATRADGMAATIIELDEHFRALMKNDVEIIHVDSVRKLIHEALNDRGIFLDNLR